jgi:ribonuclease P protein component
LPPQNSSPVQIAFAVPKYKFKKAVDRNYLKRMMRQAYRTHKHQLFNYLHENQTSLAMVLIYQPQKINTFIEIESDLITLFNKINLLKLHL